MQQAPFVCVQSETLNFRELKKTDHEDKQQPENAEPCE